MTNVTRAYLRDTEQFLAIAIASEKLGTARLAPAAQPTSHRDQRHAQARKPGGKALRSLARLLGGAL